MNIRPNWIWHCLRKNKCDFVCEKGNIFAFGRKGRTLETNWNMRFFNSTSSDGIIGQKKGERKKEEEDWATSLGFIKKICLSENWKKTQGNILTNRRRRMKMNNKQQFWHSMSSPSNKLTQKMDRKRRRRKHWIEDIECGNCQFFSSSFSVFYW